MTWRLRIVQGAQLADGLVPEVTLPEPLQRWIIGREPASHWPIADRTKAISARHCEIVDSSAGPVLRDLSTNGTFVNGSATRLAGEHVLRDGDRIEMGPYVLMVSGPPMPPRPQVVPPTVAPSARLPGVMDTAPLQGAGPLQSLGPLRGGDPAAMLAAGGGAEAVRLTEILRVAKPREDSGVELTKIRLAAPPPPKAPPPPPPPPPPVPDLELPLVPPPPTSLVQALARGLAVPESALQGLDLLVLAEALAAAAPPEKAAEARRRAAPEPRP